jgi:chloramphenicol O-acetyltransferase type A
VKQAGYSLNAAIVYAIARAANGIPEFRQRIRGDTVVEHETVHPSTTILVSEDLFSFCTLVYVEDFPTFAAHMATSVANVQEQLAIEDEIGRDDFLFLTAIPWVSFTSFVHPMHLQAPDTIPRFAWGKFFEEGSSLKMPLGVQGHHALMDGLHVGRFYAGVQQLLDDPAFLAGNS